MNYIVVDEETGLPVMGDESLDRHGDDVYVAMIASELDDAKKLCDWWAAEDGPHFNVVEVELKFGKTVYHPLAVEEEEEE